MRVPAFVAPYPHHADRHQERNARELGDGVRLVPDVQLDHGCRAALVQLCSAEGQAQHASMAQALAAAMPHGSSRRILAQLCAIARTAVAN
jgi:UDP-N-acetylglucosamine:LPS N-acetylglucosamine transferase